MSDYRLEMKGISKQFTGMKALDGVDFTVKPDEVHALLGVNGAGKSTLIKILSGVYSKDEGEILLDGFPCAINSAQDAIELGIATVYQEPEVIPSFTGYENVFLGYEKMGGSKKGSFAKLNRKKMRDEANTILKKFPVEVDLDQPVSMMSPLEREIVAILRALSREMKVLILDEPTSILTETERQVLFHLIKTLKKDGVSIIYISHRLKEIEEIADRMTVIRGGKNVATLDVASGEAKPMMIAELMLGKKMEKVFPEKNPRPGEEVLSIEHLSLAGKFHDVTFSLRKGEILGIFGLVGSGVEELAKVIFGIFRKTAGTVQIGHQSMGSIEPMDAIKQKLFLIPGDRRTEGLFAEEPISYNMTLANLPKIAGKMGMVKRSVEQARTVDLIDKLNVSPANPDQYVTFLSGGNQQKVVIGKGLFADSDVYMFIEPTVGVDVGAKTSIYELIRELAQEKGIVLISSDCEEVYGMSDRVMVMYKGEVVMERDVRTVDMEELLIHGVRGKEEHE